MPLQRVSQGFKDISMSFQSNPLNNDLIGLKNENAIARSVKNIVFTVPGEKFFNENFGSEITASLFENISELSGAQIEDEIRQSIENYEPRVELINVTAIPDYDNNQFDAVVVYKIIGMDIPPQELSFVLQPTR
jgi:phage baseplate assembly protein W